MVGRGWSGLLIDTTTPDTFAFSRREPRCRIGPQTSEAVMKPNFPVLVLLLCGANAHADNWPSWRGPTGQGVSAEKDLPVKWSLTENVRWKVPLSSPGNSTPIVWGDR